MFTLPRKPHFLREPRPASFVGANDTATKAARATIAHVACHDALAMVREISAGVMEADAKMVMPMMPRAVPERFAPAITAISV